MSGYMYKFRKLTVIIIFSALSSMLHAHPKAPRDPTQPPSYANMHSASVSSEINITAIFSGKNSKHAIIDSAISNNKCN